MDNPTSKEQSDNATSIIKSPCPESSCCSDDSIFQADLNRLLDAHPDIDDLLAGMPIDAEKGPNSNFAERNGLKGLCLASKYILVWPRVVLSWRKFRFMSSKQK